MSAAKKKLTKAKVSKTEKSKPENRFSKLPFSLTKQREVAAAGMGLKFGFVPSYQPQYYFRDTIIVLWLRTIPAEAATGWSVDQAETDPKAATRAAYEWAAQVGIAIDSNGFSEAWEEFSRTMKQVQNSTGVPIVPEDQVREDNAGEL